MTKEENSGTETAAVIDLQQEKKKRQRNKTTPDARYFLAMARAMRFEPEAKWMDGFPERFFVTMSMRKRTVVQVYDEINGLCRLLEDDHEEVRGAIQRFCATKLNFHDSYQWSPAKCGQAAEYWKQDSPIEPMPADVLFADEPGLAFHKLPFKRSATGPFPLWLEILSRMDDPDWRVRYRSGKKAPILENRVARAFCLFFGSLMDFDPNVSRAQYLWIQGDGQDTKSDIGLIINDLFGPAARYLETPDTPDAKRFFTSQLIGARVGIFSDADNPDFTGTGLWKKITGDRYLPVEFKGRTSRTERISARYVFLSQEKPNLSSKKADMRRILYVPILPFDGPPKDGYYQMLWSQTGNFLSWCMELWRQYRIDTGSSQIQGMSEAISEHIAGAVESEYEDFIERNFQLEQNNIPTREFWSKACDVHHVVRNRWPRRKDTQAFLEYLKRVHGRSSISTTFRDGPKVYKGRVYMHLIVLPANLRTH